MVLTQSKTFIIRMRFAKPRASRSRKALAILVLAMIASFCLVRSQPGYVWTARFARYHYCSIDDRLRGTRRATGATVQSVISWRENFLEADIGYRVYGHFV